MSSRASMAADSWLCIVAWSSAGFGLVFDPPWLTIVGAVCFGFVISLAASIYPAGLASRISIVRGLQYE